MRLSTTRLFPLALMFALALLTFYLDRAVRDEGSHPSLRRHDPDYVVTNFITTTHDERGAAESVMSAAKMTHYPDDDTTELVAPRLLQSSGDKLRFTVSAARGALSHGADELLLYDNVQLLREADGDKPKARMTTSFLHVVRERSLVLTDREVLLEEELRSLSGRGMEYDYSSGQLALHADVRVRFEAKAVR